MIYNKSNKELLKEFDKHVIGHIEAKKMLISLVNRSKTAHHHRWGLLNENHTIETMNCMLVGGSGTGKTHLVNTLQKIVPFPLIRLDSGMLSPGDNSDGMGATKIKRLIVANAKKLHKANPELYPSVKGTVDLTVVFIDEIDKIAGQISSRDHTWNKQVQAALLTLVENAGRFKYVSFIFAGAFVGIDTPTHKPKPMGFFNNNVPTTTKKESISSKVVEFGLLPELVGRLSGISVLDKLNTEVLEDILYNILLPQTSYLFSVGLGTTTPILPKSKASEMIKHTLESGQGIRYLKRELQAFFADIEFNYDTNL